MHEISKDQTIRSVARLPSPSAACVPAHGGALRRDVAQRLLVLPLDARVGHPCQNQSGAQALVLLRVHTQVACRGRRKPGLSGETRTVLRAITLEQTVAELSRKRLNENKHVIL